MKISKTILPAAALVALFAGCQDEDFGYKASDLQYEKEFTSAFGNVDPNQDWSMAALVTANLNVGEGTAYVYTGKPGHEGSELVGIVTNGSAQFNLIKGTKQVYVMVEQNNMFTVTGYFNVVDNVINITNNPVEKGSSATTRAETATYSVGDRLFTQTAYSETSEWDNITYCINGIYFFTYQNGVFSLYSKMGSMGVMPVDEEGEEAGYYFIVTRTVTQENGYDVINWSCELTAEQIVALFGENATMNTIMGQVSVNADGSPVYSEPEVNNKQGVRSYRTRKSWDATYYKISGDTKTTNVTWKIGDCNTLFWAGDAVFCEGENYKFTQHKLDAYTKYNTTVEEMEKGVLFITNKDNAHVDIPFMFGATQNKNLFGYYYYTADQDPLTVNRYVLYEDARPSQNIAVDGTPVGDMDLQHQQAGWSRNSVASCTSRHLVYFGKDGKSAGTLDFPKGVRIGFFIMRQHDSFASLDKGADKRTMAEIGWAYSDPNLNLKYLIDNNGVKNNTNWTYSNLSNTNGQQSNNNETISNAATNLERGSVRALCWTYDGRYLCGFGDQSNDYDLNDFVWWVDGDVTGGSKVRITSQKTSSWIVASEDLGGVYDYDFNDLVFALRKTQFKDDQTKATLELVPLAAGGTLNASVVYKNESKGEIHDLIEPGAKTDKPLNVEAGSTPVEGTSILLESEIDWNADINTIIKENIKISVVQEKDQEAVSSAYYISAYDKEKDQDKNIPQMIILPSGWDWPAEEVPVKDVYSGFEGWVKDASATTWCNTKQGSKADQYVTNPLPDVETSTIEGEEIIDPVIPGTEDQLKAWNIDFTESPATLKWGDVKLFTQVTTGTDYGQTGANYSYSVEDPTILSFVKGSGTVTLTALKVGTTTLYVTYDDIYDLNHKPTTKEFTITVNENPDRTPVFTYKFNNLEEATSYTVAPDPNVALTLAITVTKGNQGYFEITSSDSEVALVNGNAYSCTIKALKVGTATITIKHKAIGFDVYGGPWAEVTKTFTLNVSESGSGDGGGSGDGETPTEVTPVTIFEGTLTVNGNNGSTKTELSWPSSTAGYTKLAVTYTLTGAAKIQFKSEWSNAATDEVDLEAETTSKEIPLLSNGASILQNQGGAYIWNNSPNTYTITKIELK